MAVQSIVFFLSSSPVFVRHLQLVKFFFLAFSVFFGFCLTTMKAKSKKIDIRLTPELERWIEGESKKLTLSKSAYARMLLEKIRQDSIFRPDEKHLHDYQPPEPNVKDEPA